MTDSDEIHQLKKILGEKMNHTTNQENASTAQTKNYTMKWNNTSNGPQQWAITSDGHQDMNHDIPQNEVKSDNLTIHNNDKFEIDVNPGNATATLKYNESKGWTLNGNPDGQWTLKETDSTVKVTCSA